MTTIRNIKSILEKSLSSALRTHLPQTEGFAVEVEILENDRTTHNDASQDSWDPARGEIRIRFVDTAKTPLNIRGVEAVGFAPIDIEGESLSDTVLRDRR